MRYAAFQAIPGAFDGFGAETIGGHALAQSHHLADLALESEGLPRDRIHQDDQGCVGSKVGDGHAMGFALIHCRRWHSLLQVSAPHTHQPFQLPSK